MRSWRAVASNFRKRQNEHKLDHGRRKAWTICTDLSGRLPEEARRIGLHLPAVAPERQSGDTHDRSVPSGYNAAVQPACTNALSRQTYLSRREHPLLMQQYVGVESHLIGAFRGVDHGQAQYARASASGSEKDPDKQTNAGKIKE